ncbi:hypothetical protein H8E88_25270 [candidate division KSB1 bacterium]|nr:hypothetical protein [candidate division KSB1 bacterium]MBL7094964.1 hypothetical protein [candidate division KSB1 bacterium]
MNMQKRSNERSIALHKEIVKKLRRNPNLWDIPKKNILKWKKIRDRLSPAFLEWEYILGKNTKEQILFILEDDSEDSIRLRSSSPFTGILSENERKTIFEYYSQQ